MASKKQRDARRLEFYTMIASGARLSETIDALSTKYKVTKQALYLDWSNRDTWGPEFVEEHHTDKTVQDILFRITELRRRAWAILRQYPPTHKKFDPEKWPYEESRMPDKIKAIRELIKLEFGSLEAAQSLGYVHREATLIKVDEERDMLKTIVKNIAGDDIEKQESLVEALVQYANNSAQDKQ